MRKKLTKTKCTVKLRKSEYHNEWYLILESYPVFTDGTGKPKRVIEALNRTIKTPVWDKTRVARTAPDGSKTFRPKRDVNGIIQCRSETDQEACIYADGIRSIRQKEYDNADLYTDREAEMADRNQRSQTDFIDYFVKHAKVRHRNSSNSIIVNWNRVAVLLDMYTDGAPLPFYQITPAKLEDIKSFFLSAPSGGNRKGTISQNTASTYFSIVKAALKQAFIDDYLPTDIAAKVKGIKGEESRREYLSTEELNTLAETPCDRPELKRAALFSALTGMRHSDIQKLKWKEVLVVDGQPRINFTQQKTKGVEYMPISDQAYQLCGERGKPEQFVFEDLPDPSWISAPLKRWIKAAGINRNITFHSFRHTFATLQLAGGTDIYTVSKLLGHTNVKTTQVYTKVIDEKKQKAANTIKLNIDINEQL